jgi:phage protein D
MTEPALATASPVFTVNGDVAHDLGRDCVRLEVEEGVEGLRTMQAHFLATGSGAPGPPGKMLYLDGVAIDFGMPVQVSMGPDGAQRTVFDGTVSAIEVVFDDEAKKPRVVVLAEDAMMKLRMTRRMRSYTNMTDADIADAIARDHGLQSDTAVDGPTYDVVQQLNQSDLAFLRERARLIQAELWCASQTLHFASRPNRTGTSLTLAYPADLVSVRLSADLAHQRTEVAITGYDASAKALIDERAGSDVIGAEITGGRTGPDILQRALGASMTYRVREVSLTSQEARAWARAEMLRRSRRFVTVRGVTRGSPDMVVGSRLRLSLVGDPFEGDGYYTTRVRHTFDQVASSRTHFEADRATVNGAA